MNCSIRARRPAIAHWGAALALSCMAGTPVVSAQELVPAAYTPAPVGINLVTLTAGYSAGELSFDPSLPVEDASGRITGGSVAYARTLGWFGRASNVTLILPFASGDLDGLLTGERTFVERTGIADALVRLGINLYGAPAMDLGAFRSYRPRTLVGASLMISAPSGQYDPSRLINIGTNRWGFKPEFGVVHVMGRWAVDAYVGGWFYTDNSDFYGGGTRTQDPILSTQAHLRHLFSRELWAAVDVNFWRGGQTAVDGVSNDDLQRNSRVGFTVAWQTAPRHGLRLAASRGAFTRIGGDFTSVGLSYSYSWTRAGASKAE